MITVLHVDTGLKFRGGQRQVALLVKYLSRFEIKQYLAVPEKSPLFEICKDHIDGHFPIPDNNLLRFLSKGSLRKFIGNRNIDLIHAHDSHAHTMMVTLGLGNKRSQFVVTRRSSNPISFGSKTKYLRHNIHFIAISENVKNILIEGGVAENEITQIPSMIELDRYRRLEKEESYKINLVLAGAFDPSKGIITAIKAVEDLKERRDDFCLYLYGAGKTEDELKKYVNDNKLNDLVQFPGWVEDSIEYWKKADVYISTSHREGLNSSLLEAMACGVCPIVTDIEAHRENVIEGETGYLFEVDNYRMLAEKIDMVLNDQEIRNKIGKNVIDKSKLYDADRLSQRIYELYRQLVAPIN